MTAWRTARWQPPHENEEIAKEDRLRIRSNILEALHFMDGKAEFR